jgi:hypothetical protein
VKKLKRKHRIILSGCAVVLLAYFGLYLWLRMNHTFVHRAGRYGPRISRNETRPRRSTNHFIDPTEPRVDAITTFMLASEEDEDYENLMKEAEREYEEAWSRRERLLTFFEPAAFLEVCFWKIVQPNPPLPDRYGSFAEQSPRGDREDAPPQE